MNASLDEQVGWARTSALAVQAGERCVLAVTGADRLTWLNGLLTCQLVGRRPGDAVLGLAVAQKGKIVTDVVVLVGDDRAHVVVQRATVDALVASFEHHLMMEDAEMTRASDAAWFIHGPRAADVLVALRSAGARGGILDVTGRGGAVVLVGGDAGAASDAVVRAMREVGGGVGDDAAWERVRVLSGVARFGVDFDETTYPQEAALETKAVSFDKGCYLGQEVVCMLELRGHVKQKLVSLAVDAAAVTPRTPVADGQGAVVGEVRSAVAAEGGKARALAMVKYAFIAAGTVLSIEGHTATVI